MLFVALAAALAWAAPDTPPDPYEPPSPRPMAVETVRDPGMEFCADMTPTELRMFERMRQLHPTVLDAIMTLLDVKGTTRAQERRAAAPRPKRGPRNR